MFRISNLIYLYFILLSFAPIVCFLDYSTVNQGFYKIYGATLLLISLALLIRKGVNNSRFDGLIVAALVVYAYYLGWDVILQQGTYARKGFVFDAFVNPFLHIACLIFVVDNYKIPESLIKLLVKIFIGTIMASFVVSLIQFVHDPFFFAPDELAAYARQMGAADDAFEVRRTSIFGYIGMLEVSQSFLPIMALVTAYYAKVKHKIPFVWLIMGLVVVFATNSRFVQVGFLMTLMPLLILGKSKWRTLLIISFATPIIVLVFVQVLVFTGFDIDSYIQNRILANSASTRLLAFEIFQKFFGKNPWFGSGVHLSNEVIVALAGRSSQIHVGYLAHLYSYGIIGSFFAFGFWFLIARRFYRTAKITQFWGSFIGMGVFLWANVTLVYYIIFTYGLMMSFLFDRYYLNKHYEEVSKENT